MNNILDEKEESKASQMTFSKLSFGCLIIALLIGVYALTLIPSEMKAADVLAPLPKEFVYANIAFLLFNVIGVMLVSISFIKKEPSTMLKWISGILNVSIFIFFIGRIIFHSW